MNRLQQALTKLREYGAAKSWLAKNQCVTLSGVAQIHRSHFVATLQEDMARPVVVVCQDEVAAQRSVQELTAFLGWEPKLFPTRELTLFDGTVSRQWEQKRLQLLYQMTQAPIPIVVTSLEAFALRTMSKKQLLSAVTHLVVGEDYPLRDLVATLEKSGYTRSSLVEGAGQYALRGGILDVYSPAYEHPLRVEFFGDTLDAMGFFQVDTQRRTDNVEDAVLLPIAETQPGLHPEGRDGLCRDLEYLIARQKRRKHPQETLLRTLEQDLTLLRNNMSFPPADRYMALIYPESSCMADFLPENAVVCFADWGNLVRAEKTIQEQLGLTLDSLLGGGVVAGELCDFSVELPVILEGLKGKAVAYLDNFLANRYPAELPPKELLSITAKQLPAYGGSLETAVEDLRYYQSNLFATLVLCGNERRCQVLKTMLAEKEIGCYISSSDTEQPKPGQVFLAVGNVPSGMEYPALQLAILTEGQLMASPVRKERKVKAKTKVTNRQKLSAFSDLSPGDLVVHEEYGIGRFVNIEPIKTDGVYKDFIKIAYQGSDTLFVSVTGLNTISKYIGGGEDGPVRLNKLGTDTWQKTKTKAKAAAKEMAADLIKLYAKRQKAVGYAFGVDTPWQQEFEESFEYAETDDQLRCIGEIKADMESTRPMDRLLCGDVGFGKTEVALRGAMKAMLDGKQVALMAPTTVLAKQHFVTAMKRFAGVPVKIGVLSRFSTPKQTKNTMQELRMGTLDMIIGTHKLLQKSVVFKDLGLLIVDEEQRFGVSHKERLKEMSVGVDILTLSATPIPRTLNMALSGIRDMSTIEEPPHDRYPVQTFVVEYNEPILDDAITRELARGGQVYYLHNRVETIDGVAAALKKRLPHATIGVAHGKLGEEQLNDVMERMTEGEIQILVCTTIIETGIDISNVNTLIIEDADRFGLSQLHQLRGRVGRSNRHGYCYLTFQKGKILTEIAEKRLSAIRDFAEFGSGFKIAMRDLEIRGAGDLLGAEQSGHMMSVGYDMYLKLLEDAVLEEKGEERVYTPTCTINLVVTANIPQTYVPSGEQRMDIYRRMAAIQTAQDSEELLDELVDRFGDPPKSVMNLMDITMLKTQAVAVGITSIDQTGNEIRFVIPKAVFEAVQGVYLHPKADKRVVFLTDSTPTVAFRLAKGENSLKAAQFFVKIYGEGLGINE